MRILLAFSFALVLLAHFCAVNITVTNFLDMKLIATAHLGGGFELSLPAYNLLHILPFGIRGTIYMH